MPSLELHFFPESWWLDRLLEHQAALLGQRCSVSAGSRSSRTAASSPASPALYLRCLLFCSPDLHTHSPPSRPSCRPLNKYFLTAMLSPQGFTSAPLGVIPGKYKSEWESTRIKSLFRTSTTSLWSVTLY